MKNQATGECGICGICLKAFHHVTWVVLKYPDHFDSNWKVSLHFIFDAFISKTPSTWKPKASLSGLGRLEGSAAEMAPPLAEGILVAVGSGLFANYTVCIHPVGIKAVGVQALCLLLAPALRCTVTQTGVTSCFFSSLACWFAVARTSHPNVS